MTSKIDAAREAAMCAVYNVYEDRPRYAQAQMNELLARELSNAAIDAYLAALGDEMLEPDIFVRQDGVALVVEQEQVTALFAKSAAVDLPGTPAVGFYSASAILALQQRVRELEKGCDELQATFDTQWEADHRAIKLWQDAHPGNDLVWPDRCDLVVWLMGQLSEAVDALQPFAAFLPKADAFVERAAADPRTAPIMPAVKDFRLRDFRRAADIISRTLTTKKGE